MAQKQIKDLPSTSTVNSTDVLAKETSGGTTNKIAISDFVVNNLTSTSTTKALSAAQGKALSDRLSGYKIISDTATGTTDSNGLFAPSPSIPSTTKIIMVYGAGSRTIIPIVAASDSTWRFIVCNTSLQPQANTAVTIAYVALVSA